MSFWCKDSKGTSIQHGTDSPRFVSPLPVLLLRPQRRTRSQLLISPLLILPQPFQSTSEREGSFRTRILPRLFTRWPRFLSFTPSLPTQLPTRTLLYPYSSVPVPQWLLRIGLRSRKRDLSLGGRLPSPPLSHPSLFETLTGDPFKHLDLSYLNIIRSVLTKTRFGRLKPHTRPSSWSLPTDTLNGLQSSDTIVL